MEMLSSEQGERDLPWLKRMLQFAVQLEFSTIPPYLTALWSVKDTSESPAPYFIAPIVLQEMLHMGYACNLLTSLGETPQIADAQTVPRYPGGLPGGVHPHLSITLRPLSKQLIADTFMAIEEPETESIKYFLGQTFPTIGAFYTAIQECIRALPNDIFKGERQLVIGKPDFDLKAIASSADAIAAVELIKEQGEGTSGSPYFGPNPGDIGHYWAFGQLYYEKMLVQSPGGKGWSYSGDTLPFPSDDEIYPMAPIPQEGYEQSADFDRAFSAMIRQLQGAWENGSSAQLTAAQLAMRDLGQLAIDLMRTPLPGTTQTYGPCFRFV